MHLKKIKENMKKNFFKIVIVSAILIILSGFTAVFAQVIEPEERPKVDFETKFPTPRVVGPPPPTADVWTFEDITIIPSTGSIKAVQLVTLSTLNPDGSPGEPKRIATFGIDVTDKRAREILGDTEYEELMTKISIDLHLIAKAEGFEPN